MSRIPWPLRVDGAFWFDSSTWSTYMAFVLLAGLLLLVFLPGTQRIGELQASPANGAAVFSLLFLMIYGIVAMTLGQAEVEWERRLTWPGQLLHLLLRALLALVLTFPYWLVFTLAHSLSPLLSIAILLHLGLVGFVLGLFGWGLALTQRSEIFQFNLKYLGFFLYLAASFFVPGFQFLNAYWPLMALLAEMAPWPYVSFYLLWAGVGLMLALWTRRPQEGRTNGHLPGHRA